MMRNMTFSDYPSTLVELDAGAIAEVSGGGMLSDFRSLVDDIITIYDFLKDLYRKYCSDDDQ